MAHEYRLANLGWAAATVVFILVTSFALGHLAGLVAKWRGLSKGEQRKIVIGFTFAGPWIVGFLIFVLGPALVSFYYSFTSYKLGGTPTWVGLDNYRTLLAEQTTQSRQFNQAMFNSLYYAMIGVPLQIVTALGMALLLNREIPGIRVFRTVFYLPVILAGGPAILLTWRYMLGSNGGFVNEMLKKFAESFFVFDFLYRGFIFLAESFNGFYVGLTRGDPVGPLKYTLPALIGVIVLLGLALGDWSTSKRNRAIRVAEVLGLIIVYSLAFTGLVAQPIDLSWTYFAAVLTLVFIMLNARQGKQNLVRLWQYSGLLLFGAGIVLTLVQPTSEATTGYLIALVAGFAAIALSLVGHWTRQKFSLLMVIAAVFGVVIFVRLIPGQFDGGQLSLVTKYLTFQSALTLPGDLDYLKVGYPNETMSSLWFYALLTAVLVGVAVLKDRQIMARRTLIYGALVFFILFGIGSLLDGRNYFQAYRDIETATGKPTYHFTLFRASSGQFPGQDRVPLWMTNELWTKPSLVLITMWSSGAGMLIFLAALKGVPKSFYEAAEVDGASRLQRFFKITLPIISPAMFYNIVIGIIAALQTFDTIYILQTTQTQDSLASAAYFLFNRTFRQLQIGEGAAVSWILVVIILTVTVLQFRYSSWVHYEA